MAAPTVSQVVQRLAERFNDHYSGTLTDAESGQSALNLPERKERANWFRNGFFRVNTDGDAEEVPIASSSPTADPHITLSYALAGTHASGTPYEIHRQFSGHMYRRSISDAIWDSEGEAVLSNLDYQSLTWLADTWEYAVPTNFRYLQEVQILDTSGDPVAIFGGKRGVPLDILRIIPGVPRKLEFPRQFSWTVGYTIRMLGQGTQLAFDEGLLGDSSLVSIDPSFVLDFAELQLRTILADGESQRSRANASMLNILNNRVELKRANMTVHHRAAPGSIPVY